MAQYATYENYYLPHQILKIVQALYHLPMLAHPEVWLLTIMIYSEC